MKVSNSKFAHFGHFGHLVISTLFTSIAGSLMLACLCRADTAPTFIDQINFSLVDRICLDGRIDSAFVNSQNEDLFLARGFQYLRFPIQADEGESGSNGTLSISRKLGAFQSESGDSLNKNCSLLSDSSKVTSMFEIDAARVYSTNEQLTELYYQDDSSCQTKKAIEVFNKEISDQIERQKFKRVFMYRSLLLFFSDKTFAIVRTRSLKPVHEFKFYGLFTSDLIDSNFPTNVQSILSIGSHVWIVSGKRTDSLLLLFYFLIKPI